MDLAAQLSIRILNGFASDLLRRARGAPCTPIDTAIAATAERFPEIEDLKTTLEQWLVSPTVVKELEEYAKGLKGLDEVKVQLLAEILLKNTQFWLPTDSRAAAQEIVSTFLAQARDEYLKRPEFGIPHIAARVEEGISRIAAVTAGLGEVQGRLPPTPSVSAADGIDPRIDEAKGHIEKYEYDLAEHICIKLRQHSWDGLTARQKFRTLSIQATANLAQGKPREAARLYIEARDWQPDDDKALANEARAYQILGHNERAFELATRARERFPNSALALVVWLNTAPASYQLKNLEDAVPPHLAEEVEPISALAHRALIARDNLKAESFARSAIKTKGDWSFPWALLAESIFRSVLPGTPEDYGRLDSLADKGRLREAGDACTKAIELSKIEKQVSTQASVLLIRAEVRRGLGDASGGDEDVIAAWALQPEDPTALREYTRLKLQHGETRDAIENLRAAVKRHDRNDLKILLAVALSRTGKEEDGAEATRIYVDLITGQDLEPAEYRVHAITAALDGFSGRQRWEDGRAFLAQLPAGCVSATALAALKAKLELAAGNRETASELTTNAIAAVAESTSPDDLRLLATVLADLGRHRDALPLWQRLASPQQLGYDTSRFIDCALRVGQHDAFLGLCERLRSNGIYDRQLIEVEVGVREHYDLEGAIGVLQDYLSRVPNDRTARLHLSAVGLRFGRPDLVTSDRDSMPSADEVLPENWKVIVLVMKNGGHLTEALHFAYDVLRRNFKEAEAHRAYLAALLPTGPRPEIPSVDAGGPGCAVAFKEQGSTQEEWRVIEEQFEPDPGLQEIGPDHFIAQQLNGKRVGDNFLLAQGSVSSTRGTVTQVLSKYVYRYQDCASNWQRRFPGLSDIQSIRVAKSDSAGSQDIDLTEFFLSLDRIIAHQQEAIASYRSHPIPAHLLAGALNRTDFEQIVSLAVDESMRVRCCLGSMEERAGAILALRNASAVVLDLTALATLSLLGALDELQRFSAKLLVSELTFAELRDALAALVDHEGCLGFLGMEGHRYVLEQVAPDALKGRKEFLQSVIEKTSARCSIVGCPELAAVPQDRRQFLIKATGEHGAQTVVLASRPGHVLWTDDFGVATIAKHEFGVRRVWTQVALQERTEAGVIKPETFFEATAKLIGWGYRFTSPSVPALARAGSLADWNPGRRPLSQSLDLFCDTGIATRDALALAISFMTYYANEVVLPEVRNSSTVRIIESFFKRGEGLAPIQALMAALPAAFGLNAVRAREQAQVIRTWLATKRAVGWH
jgi:tetratricopeptide (TPR) repeat protein